MTTIDDLFLVRTALDARPIELVLRLTPYADVGWVLEGNPPAGDERLWMIQRLTREIALVDGLPVTVATARVLLEQPHLLGDFVGARNRLYGEARLAGVLFARCPACRQGEVQVSAAHLEFGLRTTPPPLNTADGIWLPPPKIAEVELKRGSRRGDLPLACELRVELPSHRMGLGSPDRASGCTLRDLDAAGEAASWKTHWSAGSRRPADRAWWYRENAAFRTLIRLSAAIDRLTGGAARPSPSVIEALPAIDIAYLDFAVIASQFTDEPLEEKPAPGLVAQSRTLPVVCPNCQTRYLPLL